MVNLVSQPHSSNPTDRFYGRRKGRPLRVRKSRLMAELLPQLEITLPKDKAECANLDPHALFSPPMKNLWLEIGFGGGEHLAQQAARHPDIGLIGCEPFRNGIASLLDHIDRMQIKNIRIFPEDARHLLDSLPAASIDRCFVLFADPWPKTRHAERRFIGPENIVRLTRVLKPGAALSLATDDATLAGWMRQTLATAPDFICTRDVPTPPDDWIATRYEQKGRAAGRACVYLEYERIDQAVALSK